MRLGNGFNVQIYAADDCNPTACGAFYGCTMPGIRKTQIDSLAVFKDTYHAVVNINDRSLGASRQLCENIAHDNPGVDLCMVAYAGGGSYPQYLDMAARIGSNLLYLNSGGTSHAIPPGYALDRD